MKRFMSVVLLAVSATTAQSQRIEASRFAALRPTDANSASPSLSASHAAPAAQVSKTRQFLAGEVGLVLLAGIGAGLGALVPENNGDNTGAVWAGAALGAIVGPVVGVHLYGRRHGLRSNAAATTVGSVLGTAVALVPGAFFPPLILVGGPLGATIGYNMARR